MKKFISLILVLSLTLGVAFSQETKKKKIKDRPVSEAWGSGYLIDEQTTFTHNKGNLETQIQHRFGMLKDNGISDLYGIYAPSANTRMGLSYSLRDNLEIGYGITRVKMMSDFRLKWTLLRQTRKNTIPVDVSLFAVVGIDGQNKSVFETITEDSTYKFANRLSYFTQIMISRKFDDIFTFGVNASFTHYNTVAADSIGSYSGQDHDRIGLGLFGRIRVSPQSSVVFHYSVPLNLKGLKENQIVTNKANPNFGIGYQVATASHAFEIFISSSSGILPQENYMWNNSNDWTRGEFLIGFNITRWWEF
ncbi:MAG: hypothetical protein C0598_08090 [Marinilabiliales bacterium]|nr:MAG: hypothetical protein C0598_08090 [Marinilabiliales bacterium]